VNFFEILDNLKRNNNAVILYSLLNRIPIFVFGHNTEKIDNFLIELSELIPFRKEYVFHTDFVSLDDYNNLISNEYIDFNSQRVHIRCPCSVSFKAITEFNDLSSWVIGIEIPKKKVNFLFIKELIKSKEYKKLFITISSDKIVLDMDNINLKSLDLILEQNIFKKISQDTEKSIIKMKRVLNDRIMTNLLDKDLVVTLLDFEIEKIELKKSILKKELQNFYSGSKRAFFILSRLSLLNNVEIHTKIGSKTLLETIDYEQVPIERILSFIEREWGEDFTNLIEDGKKTFIGDKIVSLWG